MPTYPSDMEPGIGLPGYYMSLHMAEPTLIVTRRRSGVPVSLPANVRVVRIPFIEIAISTRSGLARMLALAIKALGYLTFLILSLPAIIKFRPQVVHVHTPMPILQGLLIKYLLGCHLFVTLHGVDVDMLPRWRILRELVRRSDIVCYVSRSMVPILERLLPSERLLYTPSGVDTKDFACGGGERSPAVLMVGRMHWMKGYFDALKAFHKFQQANDGWTLRIVGVGPQQDELVRLAASLGMGEKVCFLGMKSRDEVAALMRDSRVFMLASLSEAFPKVLLEAASSGTPMVVTDVGSCREMVEEGLGLVVAPSAVDGLAAALHTLCQDKQMWQECSRRGPEFAEQHSWEATAGLVYGAYQAAMAH